MTLTEWFILALACLAGASSPGPSLALLVQTVIKDGRRAGVVFGLAHGLGIFFYAFVVASGLNVALSFVPFLESFIEIAGLIFMVYLAFLMFKTSLTIGQSEEVEEVEEFKASHSNSWHARSGFLIVFLNPKVAIFFLAIFTQFLGETSSFEAKSIMVLTATVIDAGWYVLITFIIAMPRFVRILEPNSKRLEFILGCIFVVICILLSYKIVMVLFG
jgi:threonine/homoserine/homoserine lactone efflux protein